MKRKYAYIRVLFFKTLPLWLFSLILVFFTVYQLAIGNPFLEYIQPGIILGVYSVVSILVSIYFSVFSVKVVDESLFIRLGAYRVEIKLGDIKKVSYSESLEDRDVTYGVSFGNKGEIFIKVDRVIPLEMSTYDGRKIIVFEKKFRFVLSSVLNLNLEI